MRSIFTAILAVHLAIVALGHEGGGPHQHQRPAHKIHHDNGPHDTTYISVRVEDECTATISRVQPSTNAPSDFVLLPNPIPKGVPVDSIAAFDPLDYGQVGLSKFHATMTWMISYEDSQGRAHGTTFLDPRLRIGESRFGPDPKGENDDVSLHHQPVRDDGSMPHHYHVTPFPDIHGVWLPSSVKSVMLYCRNTSAFTRHSIDAPRGRKFKAKDASTSQTQFWVVQNAGPVTTQHNFVFLSAGFVNTPESQLVFNTTMQRLVDGMAGTGGSTGAGFDEMHQTVPFDRYWSFYNVFAVFQPSAQAGASRPAIGLTINNNLQCYHPATLERAVTCNIEMTQALAEITPAQVIDNPDRTIIIVIVNTNLYGGSAIFRQGQFHIGHFYRGFSDTLASTNFNSDTYDPLKFNSLVKHEAGHAYGYLFDEYDIGISEPASVTLANCMAPGTTVPWQSWIDIFNNPTTWQKYAIASTSVNFAVSSSPLPVCGYSNYKKPNSNCMMNAVRDYFMCPVCREGCTKSVLGAPTLSYAWPRFPQQDAELIIPNSGTNIFSVDNGAMLYLPKAVNPNNHFTVEWRDANNVVVPNPSTSGISVATGTFSLALGTSFLSTLPINQTYTFTAYITDVTNYMTDATRATYASKLVQNTTFVIRRVASLTDVKSNFSAAIASNSGAIAVGGSLPYNNYGFYTNCHSSLCSVSFTASPYAPPPGLDALVGDFDTWALYMQGGVALVFVLLWFWAYNYYTGKSSKVVRPIFRTEFSGIVNVIRRIMIISAVGFMVASLASLGISAYFYTKTSALGKVIIVAGTVLAFGLYIMAFIGFWAVTYRSKKLVIVNGGVLYFGLTILVAANALAISIGSNIKDPKSYWNRELNSFWTNLVLYNNDRACAIEGMLQCSGFYYACNSVIQSTTECPTNCDANNRNYGTACQLLLSNYISDNYIVINQVLGACVALMFIALIFNFIYFLGLAKMKRDIVNANKKRVHKMASKSNTTLTHADKYKALYILKSLDDGDMSHLMKEFSRIDADGNGQLDRREFIHFFKRALCHTPTTAEIDEIFRVADLDGDGTISLEEFLCLFNKGAVSTSKHGSARSALRRSMDPAREAEIKRRAAKVFGDDAGPTSVMEMVNADRSADMPPAESSPRGGVLTKPAAKPYRPAQTKIPDPVGLL